MPGVTEGERELDFKLGAASRGDQVDAGAVGALGLGYGINEFWFSEFNVQYARQGSEHLRFDSLEWENVLQLSEPGEWPVDLGLLAEVEKPSDPAEGWKMRAGPLLQRDLGRLQLNLNLLLRRGLHTRQDRATRLDYQAQMKYRYREPFEFGVQAIGDAGPWDPASASARQQHRIGPALFGRVSLGYRRSLGYNAGWLFGLTDGARRQTVRVQVEYEF